MGTPTPKALIVKLIREQRFTGSVAICPYCLINGATDPHHWCFKRSSGVPDEVLHTPENVVLLCHECHTKYGQTREMTMTCLGLKLRKGYDIFAWVDRLIQEGKINHRPDIYGGVHEVQGSS